jgi:hypothetical protein
VQHNWVLGHGQNYAMGGTTGSIVTRAHMRSFEQYEIVQVLPVGCPVDVILVMTQDHYPIAQPRCVWCCPEIEEFCNTHVGGVAQVLQYPILGSCHHGQKCDMLFHT